MEGVAHSDRPSRAASTIGRVAVVGYGQLARRAYRPALRTLLPGADVLVADPATAAQTAAARDFPDALVESHHDALFDRALPDAVLIVTPPSSHLAIWRACRDRGLPVFVEKPFPLANEAERIVTPADGDTRTMVDFNRRYWPAYAAVVRRIAAGDIGHLERLHFRLIADLSDWSWKSNHRLDPREGGALQDLGGHVIDLAGRIVPLEGATLRAEALDDGAEQGVRLRIATAAAVEIVCEVGYAARNTERVLVTGSAGRLVLSDPHGFVWARARRFRPAAARSAADLLRKAGFALRPDQRLLRASVRRALRDFFAHVAQGTPMSPGLADAFRVARILRASVESLSHGRSVTLD